MILNYCWYFIVIGQNPTIGNTIANDVNQLHGNNIS